jgi:hypothetical protein
MSKGEVLIRKTFVLSMLMIFAFLICDLSSTYVLVQNTLVPVLNLIPLL